MRSGRKVRPATGWPRSSSSWPPRTGRSVQRWPASSTGLVSHLMLDERRPGGGARRTAREHAGPRVGRGAQRSPVRRHHRGDRRVRAAGPLPVGRGLPRPGHRRLRAHAGPRRRLGQQDHLHRHRLRVRRPAHRAALPREGARVGPGRTGLVRAGPAHLPSPSRRAAAPAAARRPGELDLEDVLGKRIIETRHHGRITDPRGERRRRARGDEPVRGRPALAALPAADHVAHAPPPPGGISSSIPHEAFAAFRADGVDRRGLRGEAHGLAGGGRGLPRRRRRPGPASACGRQARWRHLHAYRRPFFPTPRHEAELLERVRAGITAAGLWDELGTEWVMLDCELMPWSVKAEELLRHQYAAVGAAARAALRRGRPGARRRGRAGSRRDRARRADRRPGRQRPRRSSPRTGTTAGRWTAWTELQLAPFQILATEGAVYARA